MIALMLHLRNKRVGNTGMGSKLSRVIVNVPGIVALVFPLFLVHGAG